MKKHEDYFFQSSTLLNLFKHLFYDFIFPISAWLLSKNQLYDYTIYRSEWFHIYRASEPVSCDHNFALSRDHSLQQQQQQQFSESTSTFVWH